MTQHTPGPWALNGYQVERGEGIARTVATVAPRRQIGTDYAAPDADTAMANARLIAAAPDLLAALQGLAWAVSGIEYVETEYAEQVAQARAAIAEAQGEG